MLSFDSPEGLIISCFKNILISTANLRIFFSICKHFYIFHNGCLSQPLGKPIEERFMFGYCLSKSKKCCLNFVLGLTFCNRYKIMHKV